MAAMGIELSTGSIIRNRTRASTTSAEQACKFGTIVRALWPDKPALNLAQRIGLTERGAQSRALFRSTEATHARH